MLENFDLAEGTDPDTIIATFNMLFGFGKMIGSCIGGIIAGYIGRKNS